MSAAASFPGSVGARRLRDAFGRFGTGVAVVSSLDGDSRPCAVTVNSFVSLSLEPPLVAFSVAREARCLAPLRAAHDLVISVLRHDQRHVAANFARPSTARWEGMPLAASASGPSLVRGALVVLECTPESYVTAGDHLMFLLRVGTVHLGEPSAPLLFHASRYGSFLPDDAALERGPENTAPALGWG
ncbi:MAG TPA: flavin reductase family protein [Steroidobacteraceae bacterium]|nr:flavin reductase family protein [Steroidobacteraceae bacterium]